MDLQKMIAELRHEHEGVMQAISVIERLATGGPKRRGRPPKFLSALLPDVVVAKARGTKKRGRPPMSEEQKAAQSHRMKLYWAARKKAAKN